MRGTKKSYLLGPILLAAAASSFLATPSFAATSTWTNATTGGLWSNSTSWSGGLVASGTASTADFSELDINGAVTVHLDSPETIGNLIFGDTTTSTPGSWVLDNSGSPTNVLNLGGPTPTITVNALGSGASVTISGSIAGTHGLIKAGPGLLNLSGSQSYLGGTSVNAGTLSYIGGASYTSLASSHGSLVVGGAAGTGVVNIATSGTLAYVLAAGAFNSVGGIDGLSSTTGAGAVNQSSGTVVVSGGLALATGVAGNTGTYGSYALSGGSLSTSTGLTVGNVGQAVFTQSGGSVTVGSTLILGASGNGVATFAGGSATLAAGARFGSSLPGAGVMNVGTEAGGNALVSFTAATGLIIPFQAVSSGMLNLDSGTLATAGPISSRGTNSVVNFNGGTLQASANNLSLINSTTVNSYIYNGGAIFNTNGNVATVSPNLLATSGSGIYPSGGSLAVGSGSGYIGAPLVFVSGGAGSGATAIATIANGAISGVTLTCPGQNYVSGNVLTFTFSGGGASAPVSSFPYTLSGSDVAANGSGGVTVTGGGNLILTGSNNTYLGNTAASAGTLTVNGVLASAGSVQVFGGAALAGSGSVGNVTVLSGGILQAGQNGNGSLALNSLSLSAGGAINVYGLASTPPALQVNGNVTALGGSGSVTFDVDVNPGAGTYKVLGYRGSLAGFSALTAFVPGLGARGTVALLKNPSEVDLQVQTAYPVWTGTVSTAWNTSSVQNWKLNTNGAPTNYLEGDNVVFDDSAGTNNVIDVSSANVMPTSVQFNNNSISYRLQGSMGIAGSGSLAVNGSGGLTIATSNSYTGGTIINGGTVTIANANALPSGAGTGNVVLGSTAAATLDLNSTPAVYLNGLSGSAFGQVINSGTGTATLNLGVGDASATFSGVIADNNGGGGQVALVKSGSGTETLAGASTFSGPTTVNLGTLALANSLALPNSVLAIGAAGSAAAVRNTISTVGGLQGSGNLSLVGSLVVANNSTNTSFSGTISGSGSFAAIGSSSLTLTASNGYTGKTTVDGGGVLTYAGSGASGGNGSLVVGNTSVGVLNITSTGTFAFGNPPTLGNVGAGAINQSAGVFNASGVMEVANSGYGYYNLAGGTLIGAGNAAGIALGYSRGGVGIFNQTGGVVNPLSGYVGIGGNVGIGGASLQASTGIYTIPAACS